MQASVLARRQHETRLFLLLWVQLLGPPRLEAAPHGPRLQRMRPVVAAVQAAGPAAVRRRGEVVRLEGWAILSGSQPCSKAAWRNSPIGPSRAWQGVPTQRIMSHWHRSNPHKPPPLSNGCPDTQDRTSAGASPRRPWGPGAGRGGRAHRGAPPRAGAARRRPAAAPAAMAWSLGRAGPARPRGGGGPGAARAGTPPWAPVAARGGRRFDGTGGPQRPGARRGGARPGSEKPAGGAWQNG